MNQPNMNVVATELAPTAFSFERSFEILHPLCGGFVITQTVPDQAGFSKAFTDVQDLIEFLIQQKDKFEYDNA